MLSLRTNSSRLEKTVLSGGKDYNFDEAVSSETVFIPLKYGHMLVYVKHCILRFKCICTIGMNINTALNVEIWHMLN